MGSTATAETSGGTMQQRCSCVTEQAGQVEWTNTVCQTAADAVASTDSSATHAEVKEVRRFLVRVFTAELFG